MKADIRPVLKSYIARTGAVEKNFRRYVIEEETDSKYKRETVSITVKSDGLIDVKYLKHDKTAKEKKELIAALLPRKDEQDAIADEVKKYPFPKSIDAKDVAQLNGGLEKVAAKDLFRFYARNDKKTVRFIQQRMVLKNGERAYLPWTFWNDGLWRNKGPDGKLPLFGLENFKPTTRRLLIHEGAGCAVFAQTIPDSHPWSSDIKNSRTTNLAWVGGAYSFDHVDWSDIINADAGIEVIFFADNDQSGENVIPKIAKLLNRPVKVVRFDNRFPPTFDMKDDWPKNPKWWQEEKYVGPSLTDMLKPASWATDVSYNDKGPPSYGIRSTFEAEWFCVVIPQVFVHRADASTILTPIEFNNLVRSYSDVDDTGRLLAKSDHSKTYGLKYLPGEKPGAIQIEGKRYVNTHTPSNIKAVKGDPQPFLDFMEHLVTVETDRLELERWCATLIARPEFKMLYGVLLISENQGVGKGTLGEKILAPIIGEHNVSYPSENEIVESNFNYWLAHKRLAVVHEIYAGHSAKAYNKLKSTITDKNLTISKKYQANYDMENCIHVFACSNSTRALKLATNDRRWFVPKITEEKKNPEWWDILFAFLAKDGLGIIKQWSADFIEKHGAVEKGDAPMTATKAEIIDDARGEGEKIAIALATQLKGFSTRRIMSVYHAREYIKAMRGLNNTNTLEAEATVRQLLLSVEGIYKQESEPGKQRPRHLVNGTLTDIVSNEPIAHDVRWSTLDEISKWIPDANKVM